MLNVNFFLKAIRMSWLRRLITSKSTWANLHKLETFPNTFNPYNSNQERLIKAKEQTNNYFWKDVYASLLQCRLNVTSLYPQEAIHCLLMGSPKLQAIIVQLVRNGVKLIC